MRKILDTRGGVLAFIAAALLAPATLTAHASEPITADVELGLLQLDLVNVMSNRMLVCPPGLNDLGEHGCGKMNRDRTLKAPAVAPVTPQAYLQTACPEVKIISLSVSNLRQLLGQVATYPYPVTVTLVTSGVCDPQKLTFAGKNKKEL
ncbi:hypothetical protein ACV344_30900 [Pseudomonas aeruginosa]|uniref:hypothetical protein n=1 Tax=Pseudomonas aeruginosa TaxID=287 RepID=UPI000E67946F|nr:hypothetical protein [Pseudomonas aeruginosa]MBA5106271.1 hypothetical protein [Pseudomonas aeruginosa]MBD1300837.1 hypothetical protein [Pseudomonas aeruginosa]MBD1341598.1 hypothetical protein [Pseudomonas aeruginosa]MBG4604314.1 hypothetical protein [Pseudomonas aeruginosa]MBH3593038.1 hypothetical protein [Pseudomonas aeruginosa]